MDHGDGVTGGVVPGMEGYVFDDACVPVALLAVAYTNVDGEDGYNPDVDVLIARFEDIDDDGVPSVGDIIRTNRYPIDFNDLTGAGTFGVTQHTITDDFHVIYSTVSLDLILTETDTGTDQVFRWTTNTEGTTELYQEVSYGAEFTLFRDAINVSVDLRRVNPVSPSQPDAAAGMENLLRPSDDPFIDVDITPPPA